MNELRLGKSVNLAGVTLTPIERVRVDGEAGPYATWFHATKDPVALLIQDAHTTQAFDITGRVLSVDALIERVPELAGSVLRGR